MAQKISAFKTKNGEIVENEIHADLIETRLDIVECVTKLDFTDTRIFNINDCSAYTLQEFVRLGRMAEKMIDLKDKL